MKLTFVREAAAEAQHTVLSDRNKRHVSTVMLAVRETAAGSTIHTELVRSAAQQANAEELYAGGTGTVPPVLGLKPAGLAHHNRLIDRDAKLYLAAWRRDHQAAEIDSYLTRHRPELSATARAQEISSRMKDPDAAYEVEARGAQVNIECV